MNTYNIYRCVCGYLFDCSHSITVTLRVECPDCKRWVQHIEQIDEYTLREVTS